MPFEESFVTTLESYRFDEALDVLFVHIGKGDSLIQETQPFKMLKSVDESVRLEGKVIIEKLVRHVYRIAEHLVPFMPETAEKIKEAVRLNKKPDTLFARLEK